MSGNINLMEDLGKIWFDIVEEEQRLTKTELHNLVMQHFRKFGSRLVSKSLSQNRYLFCNDYNYFVNQLHDIVMRDLAPIFNTVMLNIKLDFDPNKIKQFQNVTRKSSRFEDKATSHKRSSIVTYIRRRYNEVFLDSHFYRQVRDELGVLKQQAIQVETFSEHEHVNPLASPPAAALAGHAHLVPTIASSGHEHVSSSVSAPDGHTLVALTAFPGNEPVSPPVSVPDGHESLAPAASAGHELVASTASTASTGHKSVVSAASASASASPQQNQSEKEPQDHSAAAAAASQGSSTASSYENWCRNVDIPSASEASVSLEIYAYYVVPQPELVTSVLKLQGIFAHIDFEI
jgi:hypothetical protein